MKLDPRALSGPIAALVALLLISFQTADALRRAGTSKENPVAQAQPEDPMIEFERRLALPDPNPTAENLRDPFGFAAEPAAVSRRTRAPLPASLPPPPPPPPILTAIIWDNDPSASIRWNGRDYSVKVNSQISDYQVVRIGRDHVVLTHGGESLILRLHRKGE